MSEKVTIPAALREKLARANGDPIPLCDDAGNVVGYYLSAAQMAAVRDQTEAAKAWRDALWPPEEIARIRERLKDTTRPKRTTADLLKLAEGA